MKTEEGRDKIGKGMGGIGKERIVKKREEERRKNTREHKRRPNRNARISLLFRDSLR